MNQAEADALMAMPKRLLQTEPIKFPLAGDYLTLEAQSRVGRALSLI